MVLETGWVFDRVGDRFVDKESKASTFLFLAVAAEEVKLSKIRVAGGRFEPSLLESSHIDLVFLHKVTDFRGFLAKSASAVELKEAELPRSL